MKNLITSGIAVFLFLGAAFGQFSITGTSTQTIDFTGFNGTGFTPSPASGQLDSDNWSITGLSDGDLVFGGTGTSGDYARGTSNGGVSSGGVYAFSNDGGTNYFIGFQPTGGDFTPGDITLKIQNNTGSAISSLNVSYTIYENNNATRSNSLTFSHSADDSSYTDVADLDYTTSEASATGWTDSLRSTIISSLNISNGNFYYLRWSSDDVSGSGSRDEFGIDDIKITAVTGGSSQSVTLTQTNSGTDVTEAGLTDTIQIALSANPAADVMVIASPSNAQVNLGNGNGVSDTLTFESGNGTITQEFIVSADDDSDSEGNHSSIISFSVKSSDTDFDGLSVSNITVNIEDNDGDTIRILTVNTNSNIIQIKNFGMGTRDISSFQVCAKFSYASLNSLTINSGSLSLRAGETVTLSGFSLGTSSDLGLYNTGGNFGSTSAMEDFVQWGSANNGRESVAVSKGIWTDDDFIVTNNDGFYYFLGNSGEHGLEFWMDTEAPTINSLFPLDGATKVNPSTSLEIIFNEEVRAGIGTVQIFSGETLVETIDAGGDQITFSGSSMTINPTLDLDEDSAIYVTIEAGTVKDTASNDFAGITSTTEWNFTTGILIRAGDLVITEFMPDPSAVNDSKGEYFEIFNTTQKTLDLNGLEISDAGSNSHTIDTSLTIAPKNYLTLGTDTATGTNGGANVTYEYSSYTLANGEDEIILKFGGVTIDSIGYDGSWGITSGFSLELLNPMMDNNNSEFWTKAENTFGDGDKGSPGMYNSNFAAYWSDDKWAMDIMPSDTINAFIDDNYMFSANGPIKAITLLVNTGDTLVVDSDTALVVTKNVRSLGKIAIESGSSLITFDSGQWIGESAFIKRTTRYADGRYSFVGTPVEKTDSITGKTLGDQVYEYDESVAFGTNDGLNRWVDARDSTLIPGKGYAQAFKKDIVFEGTPNTGSISVKGGYSHGDSSSAGWNLIANPFTAPISIDSFLVNNSNIIGSIYLWDDNGSNKRRGDNSDYITVNAMGIVGDSRAGQGASRWNSHILSCQGFFVKIMSGNDSLIYFNENMRVTKSKNKDDNFFRQTSEFAKVKLSLTNKKGSFKETLIGFSTKATIERDWLFDADLFETGDFQLYSIIGNGKYAIQGLPVLTSTQKVDLGLGIKESGSYTIEASLMQNLEGYFIGLQDFELGLVHDLSTSSYTFEAGIGEFNDRFDMIMSKEELVAEPVVQEDFYSLVKLHGIEIHTGTNGFQIRTTISDITGKKLLDKTIPNARSITYVPFHFEKGKAYIVNINDFTSKLIIK